MPNCCLWHIYITENCSNVTFHQIFHPIRISSLSCSVLTLVFTLSPYSQQKNAFHIATDTKMIKYFPVSNISHWISAPVKSLCLIDIPLHCTAYEVHVYHFLVCKNQPLSWQSMREMPIGARTVSFILLTMPLISCWLVGFNVRLELHRGCY